MKDTAVLYYSKHHGNTEKVLRHLAAHYSIDLYDVTGDAVPSLSDYKAVGFASGVYMSNLHKSLFGQVSAHPELAGKPCFIVHTSGAPMGIYSGALAKSLTEQGADYLGTFRCRGFDTYGPLRLIGGIAKQHPNQADLQKAEEFYKTTVLAAL